MPFLIVGPTGEQYELTSVEYFLDQYAPQGFTIVTDPPTGYDVPEVKASKKDAKATATTTPAPAAEK